MFQTRPGAHNDESIIEILGALHDKLGGAKVTLIWMGCIAPQPPHADLDPHPAPLAGRRTAAGYPPDLNPVEGLWGNVKGTELANLCADRRTERLIHARGRPGEHAPERRCARIGGAGAGERARGSCGAGYGTWGHACEVRLGSGCP